MACGGRLRAGTRAFDEPPDQLGMGACAVRRVDDGASRPPGSREARSAHRLKLPMRCREADPGTTRERTHALLGSCSVEQPQQLAAGPARDQLRQQHLTKLSHFSITPVSPRPGASQRREMSLAELVRRGLEIRACRAGEDSAPEWRAPADRGNPALRHAASRGQPPCGGRAVTRPPAPQAPGPRSCMAMRRPPRGAPAALHARPWLGSSGRRSRGIRRGARPAPAGRRRSACDDPRRG